MLVLDGTSGVDVGNVAISGEFTIEGWFYFEPGAVIDNKDGFFKNDTNQIHLNFWEGQLRLAAYTGPIRGDVVIANTAANTGEWNHYALTRDANGILQIYVNGVLDATATQAWNVDFNVDEIGETLRGATEGAMDELRIWDHARSGSEIASAMSSTVDPGSAGLLANYRFDNAAEIDDATGNAA
ncbi:MAG: LamG domain-containing protein, partial [Pseudomonadota bacterium]